jgi:DNA invertase Pin-like site-specific DNA recombinase
MIAAIYARKSTEQTGVADDAKSVARQIENARAFAVEKGWRVGDVYSDDAISGAEVDKLKDRQRLLRAIEGGPPFKVLIMREGSRFSRRDGDEAFGELKRIAQAGVEIWFYLDRRKFSFGTMGENVSGFVEAEMNAEYRRQIAKYTSEAMRRKALAGHVTGGKTFGYDNVDVLGPGGQRSHVVQRINANQAATVTRIFELSAAGDGYTSIAIRLNAEGAPAPGAQRGRPRGWASASIREALHRTKYRGVVTWGATKKRTLDGRVKSHARPTEEHLVIEAPQLRIVSEELWGAAHARLAADRARYTGRPKGRPPAARGHYLLTGMAVCGVCGGGIEATTRTHGAGQRVRFYSCARAQRSGDAVCTNRLAIRGDSVDAAVLELMETAVLSDDVRDAAISEATRRLTTRDDDVAAVRREMQQLRQRADRLADQVETGTGTSTTLVERLRNVESLISEGTVRQKTLEQAVLVSPQRIRAELTTGFQEWRALLRGEPAAGRRVLQTLIDGRLTFTPKADEEGEFYDIEGLAALPQFVGGKTLVNLASPAGNSELYTRRVRLPRAA